MRHSRSYLSPHTAMAIVILNQLGGHCEAAVLPLLLGVSETELSKYIQEIGRLGLLEEEPVSIVSIAPMERTPQNILDHALFASTLFTENTVASALYSYHRNDFRRFLELAAGAIEILNKKNRPLGLRRAYDALAYTILKMRIPLQDKDFCFNFIEKCMKIQREVVKFPINSRNLILLYQKIKGVAFYVGDRRSIGYINICMGSINHSIRSVNKSKLYHRNMKKGKEIIFSLGDRDIIMMSSPFVVLYYLLEAEFNEGINFAYSSFLSGDEDSEIYLKVAPYVYTSICAVSMGNYALAGTILISGKQRIAKFRKDINTDTISAFLSYVYLLQDRDEEALQIIDELLRVHGKPILTYAGLWASRLLAYYHYRNGNLQESYACFKNLLGDNTYGEISHSNYLIAPFVLKLLAAYHIAGYPPPQKLSIHEELRYSMASPSRLVQAVALCIAGQVRAHEHGWDDRKVRTYLEKSLHLFRTFSAPPDMARTLLTMARMHQAVGETDQARETAAEAWAICRHYGQPIWPSELDPLLTPSMEIEDYREDRSFDLSIQLFSNIRSQSSFRYSNNLLNGLLGSLLATFGIISGCVSHVDGRSPDLVLSLNMDERTDRALPTPSWRELIQRSFREKQSIVIKRSFDTDDDAVAKTVNSASLSKIDFSVAIFVDARDSGIYIFYATGVVPGHIANTITDEFIEFAENFLSTQICINITQNAVWQDRIGSSTRALQSSAKSVSYSQDDTDFVFKSRSMKGIVDLVDNLAKKDITVVILGESGVGKELIAKRIHANSLRKGEFISVNLSNIPYDLFESECYGHEKGSFTGANYQKRGLFELADNGTLFIDEIGDIPLSMQVKLLRVLQEKQFMRVGGTKILRSNFRLITATNRDLPSEIQRGRFREDLYYRLNVVSIRIPPLRERKDDILYLVDHFLLYYCNQYQLPPKNLSAETKQRILNYPWPGNVRELKNCIERYCVLSDNDILFPLVQIDARQPKISPRSADAIPEIFHEKPSLQNLSDTYFEYIYTTTDGTVGGANGIASIMGISRTTAYAWIERLGLKEKYRLVLRRAEM